MSPSLEQEIAAAIDRNVDVDVDCSDAWTSHRIKWRGTNEAVTEIMDALRRAGMKI
jgi:hypothetical protein